MRVITAGEMSLGEVDGILELKNQTGKTWIGEVTGPARIKSANGDITVDRAHDSIVVKTANGDIRVGEVGGGPVVLETAAGAIDIGLRSGVAAWLDARTSYGRVLNLMEGVDPDVAEGKVEAAVIAVGTAQAQRANVSLASHGGLRFLDMKTSPEALAAMRKILPARPITIEPAPHAIGIVAPTTIMAYSIFFSTGARMPDDVVYEVAKAIHAGKDELLKGHPVFRGFDPEEVEAFLEEVAEALEAALKENVLLREQLQAVEERMRGIAEREKLLQDTLTTTQRLAEDMKEAARREAALQVREGELEREKMLEAARGEEARILNSVQTLKRTRRQLVEELRATLDTYQRWIAEFVGESADAPPS